MSGVAPAGERQAFLHAEASSWLQWDPNSATKAAVQAAVEANDLPTLETYFGSGRLEFGTAGLRGRMGPGNAAMNDLTVIQTTQAVATILEEDLGEAAKQRGVVIGYDHRAADGVSSSSLARAAAAVLLYRGFKVYLYQGVVHTPLVPYGIQRLHAAAGIMVTASHNPKQDNGYKLYWGNAVQIISPIDKRVAKATSTASCLCPWALPYVYDDVSLRAHPLCADETVETAAAYFADVAARLCRFPATNPSNFHNLKIVYTPMHGVGHTFAARAFEAFHLPPYYPVPCQQEPDPEFPTVRFPNPEEKGALSEACKLADAVEADLVIANDPDADRMALAERRADGDGWRVFSGNEIGTLLGCWQWEMFQASNNTEEGHKKKAAVVCSTVSSKMLRAVARAEGFEFHETLTGFKWLGHRAQELAAQGTHCLLAYEEAIGYCVGDVIADKDGVSAAAVTAEMAGQLKAARGLSVSAYLSALHAKYGEFASQNSYFFLPSDAVERQQVLSQIFSRLRDGGKYWEAVGGYKIRAIRDLTSPGFDSSTPDKRPTLPVSSSTQMLTYEFENGCVLTLRTSGTEPKLKYYSELQGRPGVKKEEVDQELKVMLSLVLQQMIEPQKHGIKAA